MRVDQKVAKAINAGRDRLAQLDEEEAVARKLVGTKADQLGVEIRLSEIENERLKIQADQLLATGSARRSESLLPGDGAVGEERGGHSSQGFEFSR